MQISEGSVSWVEGTASDKVLSQVLALRTCTRGKGVPVWLQWGRKGCLLAGVGTKASEGQVK